MKRRRVANFIKVLLIFVVLGVLLAGLSLATEKMGRGQKGEQLGQMERSIRRATMTCYATEGVYPPSIQYMEDNYGIQIDENLYTVFYEVHGENLMPEITVMEKQKE